MIDDMPWWLGNQVFFVVFVLSCVIIALIVGRARRGDAEFWRGMETAATLAGGISFLLLSFNVEYVLSNRYFDNNRGRYAGASIQLTSHSEFVVRYACDTKFEKSEYSPKNFDDMVSDQIIVCAWARGIKAKLNDVDFSNIEEIDISIFNPPSQKTDRWHDEITGYMKGFSSYTLYRDQMENLKDRSKPSDGRLVLLLLAPYLLGIAFAMQLAKVRYK